MINEKKETLVDNDFLQYFMRNPKVVEGKDLFVRVFSYMNRIPVIHPYIFECEMFQSIDAKLLVDTGEIRLISYNDFLVDQQDKVHYAQMFAELYRMVNGERFSLEKHDVFTYRKAKENLGEIHSLLTASWCKYDLFLSNDIGSKEIAENQLGKHKIEVLNVMDIFLLFAKNNTSEITAKEFALLTKGDRGRKLEIKKILEIWNAQ